MRKFLLVLTLILGASLPAMAALDADTIARVRAKAERGDAAAQNNLGLMYYTGQGVSKNYALAIKWYRKAAVRGYAYAQLNLGVMYGQGKGVPKNYREAIKWYRKAAVQGNANAQFNLGRMYERGQGVPRNYVLAYMWWSLSAARGAENAAKNLNSIETRMTPADVSRAQAMAAKWRPKKYRPATTR